MELSKMKEILEILSSLIVLLGIPTGIYQYWSSKKKEQADREYGTYNALDEKYLEFQRLCLEHPQLDVFDIPDRVPSALNEEERKLELVAFTLLFSIFERAYLMYYDQSNKIKKRQWSGWDEYIESYCRRDNFRNAWRISGNTFDSEYQAYMKSKIQSG
jgi:hypothetical protein